MSSKTTTALTFIIVMIMTITVINMKSGPPRFRLIKMKINVTSLRNFVTDLAHEGRKEGRWKNRKAKRRGRRKRGYIYTYFL